MQKFKTPRAVKSNLDEDDELFNLNKSEFAGYFEQTVSVSNIDFYIDEDIKQPKYYRAFLNRIASLTENDLVNIHLNTYGGSLDSAVSIINAMQGTEAEVVVTIEGVAASAGSLIALSADNLQIMPHARMMIHSATYASGGKQNDILSHVQHTDRYVKQVMAKAYFGFVTPEELAQVFQGIELWFDYDEIIERLKKRNELLQSIKDKEEAKQQVETSEQEDEEDWIAV